MTEYKRESISDSINYKEYRFITEEGTFEGDFTARWLNHSRNLMCCFDFDDGRRIRAIAWADRDYCQLDQVPLGSRLRLIFRKAKTGKTYLRRAEVL